MNNALFRFFTMLVFMLAIGDFHTQAQARENLGSIGNTLESLRYSLSSGILQANVAKEICSCRYISGHSLEACLQRIEIPAQALEYVNVKDYPDAKIVQAIPVLGIANIGVKLFYAEARFNTKLPRHGCRITHGYLEEPGH